MKYYVLYNGKANNGRGYAGATTIQSRLQGEKIEYVDAYKMKYDRYFAEKKNEDCRIVLCGGDGTLNYFVNHTTDETREIDFDFFPTGTGNDFCKDIESKPGEIVKNVNKYLKNLPTVTVNGKSYKFINGVGYGIDGYCCEIGDVERSKSTKPVNYTAIAIKGILFHFKPRTATIIIDNKPEMVVEYSWLVPTMKGRCYGGGMYPAPSQDRNATDGKLSVMTYRTKSAIKALAVFPKIFKGEHIKSNIVNIYTGYNITVRFDKPCSMQIDGETILNVSEYVVNAK